MSDVKTAILELNRRLLHRCPRANFLQTVESDWYRRAINTCDNRDMLRWQSRTCRIARRLHAEHPTPEMLATKQLVFDRLAYLTAEILCRVPYGGDQRPLARKLFASVLREGMSDPTTMQTAMSAFDHFGEERFERPISRRNIETEIRKNVSEPGSFYGWDYQTRVHMQEMAKLAALAPTPELTDKFATRALIAASASLAGCTKQVTYLEPESFSDEGMFLAKYNYGNKPLVTHVADSVTDTAEAVLAAVAPESAICSYAERLKARADSLREQAAPKVEIMQIKEAERRREFDEHWNRNRPTKLAAG